MVYVWCPCGVHVVYVLCLCGVCVVPVYCLCGVYVVSVWYQCGICVVHAWCGASRVWCMHAISEAHAALATGREGEVDCG